ncbi:MAG TPA: fumarylacetoacetate hydrolase family protein [Acidimicrobiales bacterium]
MKLATIRDRDRTMAVRIDGEEAVELDAADVGEVLHRDDWPAWAGAGDGPRRPVADLDYAPLIVAPDKIVCCGLNYRNHILEFTRELPSHPTLFAKYRSTLTGAYDDIELPTVTDDVDWEVELAVIIGTRGRAIPEADAGSHIAGYAVLNDVSMREYQNRTLQWLQGKCFEATTPLGPWLVTSDESPGPSREVVCEVDGEVKQKANTSDLLFGPEHLVSYISDIITLEPGDVIATGTPGGVGFARDPKEGLVDGSVMVTRIEGLGECRNVFKAAGA